MTNLYKWHRNETNTVRLGQSGGNFREKRHHFVTIFCWISDSNKGTRASTAYNATVALMTWYNEIRTNKQAAEVFGKAMNDPASLSKDEVVQFIMGIHSVVPAYQNVYFAGVEGTLDSAMYKAHDCYMRGISYHPRVRLVLATARQLLHYRI